MVAMPASAQPAPHHHDDAAATARQGSPGVDGAPRAARDRGEARVELLVKDGCHLCAEAIVTTVRVCTEAGENVVLLDARDHPELFETHAEEIPVLFVDGVQRDFWRVDPVRLARLLTR